MSEVELSLPEEPLDGFLLEGFFRRTGLVVFFEVCEVADALFGQRVLLALLSVQPMLKRELGLARNYRRLPLQVLHRLLNVELVFPRDSQYLVHRPALADASVRFVTGPSLAAFKPILAEGRFGLHEVQVFGWKIEVIGFGEALAALFV